MESEWSVRALAHHIDELLTEHDIHRREHSSGGRAWKKIRTVAIRPVKSTVTYAIALHEIGHVLGPDQSKPSLFKETGAWQWAIDNALPGAWDDRAETTMQNALRSYLDWALARQYRERPPTIPPADHDFWHLAGVPHPSDQ